MTMNIIGVASDFLGWTLINVALGIKRILEVNYHTVDFLVNIATYFLECFSEFVLSVLGAINCCFRDFVMFSKELAWVICVIFTTAKTILLKAVNQIHTLSCFVTDFVSFLYVKFLVILNAVVCCLEQFIENAFYLSHLIYEAILLILQLVPNLLLLSYELLFLSINYLWTTIYTALFSVLNNLSNFRVQCQNAIFNVPPKAYFGIIIIVIIFYTYRPIVEILKSVSNLLLLGISNALKIISQCLYSVWIPIAGFMIKFFNKALRKLNLSNEEGNSPFHREEQLNNLRQSRFQQIYNCFSKTKINFEKLSFYKRRVITDDRIKQLQNELLVERDRHLCIICHEREKKIILLPCRHLCLCRECTITLQHSNEPCPLCRHSILDVCSVYT